MDSFGVRRGLRVGEGQVEIVYLPALADAGFDVERLPYTVRILLENLLRHEDGESVRREDIEALARWPDTDGREFAFRPARVLLQDFTGVPALVDLAALRDAVAAGGGDPGLVGARTPVELVVDHSIQVDAWGTKEALGRNEAFDYSRNGERYRFLRWGQQAFRGLRVVPPDTGIVHQVNLEHLARVVFQSEDEAEGPRMAWPDTLVGTDSHTPMIGGLGVLGWGVGGIEAEAALLGLPLSLAVPRVLGLELVGRLREGATATDLVLTLTELLRRIGVVGAFVEAFGEGVEALSVPDRATVANMSPEFGATTTVFPPDRVSLDYLRATGRAPERLVLVERYLEAQGLLRRPDTPAPRFSSVVTFDLSTVEPSVAGPRRPQERAPLSGVARSFHDALPSLTPASATGTAAPEPPAPAAPQEAPAVEAGAPKLAHGAVVIAAITSCTNTSNPDAMMAAGLLAKAAVDRGLTARPWVKTSLAPGSKVVPGYLSRAGVLPALEALGFNVVGYGCTTCIGNSGPLPTDVSTAIARDEVVAVAVLSGNRNFEGRIHPEVRASYLMSPPLVVAYALAGRIDHDFEREPLGIDDHGRPIFLRELWPDTRAVREAVASALVDELFRRTYAEVDGRHEPRWTALTTPLGERFAWEPSSTYVLHPPWFEGVDAALPPRADIHGARVLVSLGDAVTTDHISPAGAIPEASPAGRWLLGQGVEVKDFNSYGSRRGNHEVMVRGTFANARLKNRLVPGTEGGVTVHFPSSEELAIFDAAVRYHAVGTPLVVLAGRDYGAGSSRDWAAKGPALLGVKVVIASSYERIHRSNLVGMGILPLQLHEGVTVEGLGLSGAERFDIEGIPAALDRGVDAEVRIRATAEDGREVVFTAKVRLDSPADVSWYRHGGLLPSVLRGLLARSRGQVPAGPGSAPEQSAGVASGASARATGSADAASVDEASLESFPASDPPVY